MGNSVSQNPMIDKSTVFVHIIISIIFIILILSLLWTNNDTFDTVGDKLKYTYENLYYKFIKGANYFYFLSKDENIQSFLKDKKEAIVVFLAPWCKYSKKLKQSGILEKISKTKWVIVIDDLHPDTEFLMNTLNLKVFPSICIYENKKLSKITYKNLIKSL